MDRLGGHVRQELGRFRPADGDIEAITRAWPAAVGASVARNAWPARLARDGTLHVHVASSTWGFELGKLAATILEQLRAELAEATPQALKFAPGPLPAAAPAAGRDAPQPPEIGSEHRAEAAAIAAGIEDEELRELVARAAAASLAGASGRGSQHPRDDLSF